MTTACAGTTKKGGRCTQPAARGSDYCYLHDSDPAIVARRKRNASRAATLGNSKIDAEIRAVRLMAKELVELTVSGELDVVVRKRLTEIAQLLQIYARLAELELVAGGGPKFSAPGEYGMPSDTAEKARDWAEGEAERERKKQEFMGTLEQATKDPRAALKVMGG